MFSLLMALLMWGGTLTVQWSESLLYKITYSMSSMGMAIDPETGMADTLDEGFEPEDGMVKAYNVVKAIGIPLPKTREATYMLKKKISFRGTTMTQKNDFLDGDASQFERKEAPAAEDYDNRHSSAYIIGTSLAFEAVVLGLACLIFVRRDY